MTTTTATTIRRAVAVVAENAGRRVLVGYTFEKATADAIAEFSAQWPTLGSVVAQVLAAQ